MCGICGFYAPTKLIGKGDLDEMTWSLAHRGPDAEGYYHDDNIGLGHKRLSILDLSSGANQPMTSHCGKYVMVYNGEVYNYREIATDLEIVFNTTSDTEVVLEAYVKWGAECLRRFNGMFAFAIYNKQEKTIFLARDRIGIKPLLYYWDGENFAFASELKALLKVETINDTKTLNKAAISSFLHLGYIPQPMTIYQNIYKFPAGGYSTLSGGKLVLDSYWNTDANIAPDTICGVKEAKSQLTALLSSSVRYRLISDVPFGTFLSGGTDSSVITAMAQRESPEPVKTFTIGFEHSKYNEAPNAKAIAKYLGTDHHEYMLSHKDAIQLIDGFMELNDEPFADSSALPTLLVSKLASQNATMVLSGDGGDELFLGYGAYRWAERLANPFISSARKPLGFAFSQLPGRYKRIAHLFEYTENTNLRSHIFSQEQYLFAEREIRELLCPEYLTDVPLLSEPGNTARKLTPAEDQALFDITHYLKDDLLVKVDRATMQYSLECRLPFLDHRIVDFALNIPPHLKYRNGVSKFLLKSVLYDFIPKKFFDRPKWGFSVPMSDWLKKDLRYLIEMYLSENMVAQYGVLNYPIVTKLKRDFFNGREYLYNRLWVMVCLQRFMQSN